MTTLTWRFSTVLSNVWPVCVLFALFASLIAWLPPMLLPRVNPFPLSPQGTAIGLLLGARTLTAPPATRLSPPVALVLAFPVRPRPSAARPAVRSTVFRTNNSYLRLSEARELWGRAIVLCREVAQVTLEGLEPPAF